MAWDNPVNRVVLGPKLLKEMEQEVVKIKQNLKEDQDKQKSYANKHRVNRELNVGDHVYLIVREKKSSLKLGSCASCHLDIVGRFKCLKE